MKDESHSYLKRGFDLVAGVLGFVALSPVMIAVALAVVATMGMPLFFVQSRSGLGGKAINLLKFRSMTDARDANGQLLPDDHRTPSVGFLIRRYRVDELPSLFNIVRGDISLVGPRPLLKTSEANVTGGMRRLSVKPGLTGLSQISGNTLLSEHEKLAVDLYYIANRSMAFDLRIVLQTLMTVIHGERRDEALISRALALMAMDTAR
ncbi:sugar transferase [Sphingomonas sp. SUN039]|uniref:sugar transferase n=1 Tax=Sphingomonas sp. SUN039 TaxID=2937787 RepID=UPI002164274B|nr:sugar transferase [Sphingomonas sp. SUN039]UVO52855.1 sugar transferase [Sphingomonas sp. SUN039]